MPKADATSTPSKKYVGFEDLKIWQAGMDLCKDVYQATEGFVDTTPSLAADMRSSVVNYPASIAQSHGYRLHNSREYAHLLREARKNLTKLEIQTILAKNLGLLNGEADQLTKSIHGLTKMTNSLIRAINQPKQPKVEMTETE
ncbi:MAG TPA: four helix bundle protein [Patescibacteria group bacterium]